MAGDWIKMRTDLQTHPKVVRISSALKADRLRAIGGLHAVWSLFDAHSIDGSLVGYTLDDVDSLIGWPGFTQAMESVGWIDANGEALCLPRFDDHNGQSAKRRATETKRKRDERNGVRKTSASSADKKRTREEKRREEVKKEKTTSSPKNSAKDEIEGLELDEPLRAYARKHGQDADDLLEDWRLHFRGNGYKTTAGPVADGRSTFMRWIRTAAKMDRSKRGGSLFNQQPRHVAIGDEE